MSQYYVIFDRRGVAPFIDRQSGMLLTCPHMNRASFVLLVTVGLLTICLPLVAHHGTNISYDRSKPVTMQGTVTEFRFANPHPQLFVDVKDSSGNVTNWGCEIAAIKTVIPAQARIHLSASEIVEKWVPAFAGMTS